MADLTNDELRAILEKRAQDLENGTLPSEIKQINPASVQFILKTLALPADFAPLAQKVLELAPRTSVIWMHLEECTGCSESLLRADVPDLAELIFDFLSLEYHETVMVAAGWQAESNIDKILEEKKDFILAVEGGVSPIDTFYLTIGAHAQSGYECLMRVAKEAKAVFAMGTCSSYGGIQAADPNIVKACGIGEVLTQKIVYVPGCPPSDINIIMNLCFYALFQTTPNVDEKNRPKWAYGKCLHDMCERKAKFESGIFAQKFDDDLAKSGACLFKVGCKGPYTYNNCPKVKFNAKTSWPVQSGHGCMACSEPNFWDEFGSYEEPMRNVFAYRDNSFKGFKLTDALSKATSSDLEAVLNDTSVVLSLENELGILYKEGAEVKNFLNFEFESNPRVILANLSKNKMGLSLVQIYQKELSLNYAFIEANYDETPRPSKNLKDYFEYVYVLAKGEKLADLNTFLSLAASYKIKHASPFEVKMSLNDNEAKLDVSKSFRMPLIYLCGGLDAENLAFSACEAIFKQLKEALKFLSKKQNKQIGFNFASDVNAEFLHSKLA